MAQAYEKRQEAKHFMAEGNFQEASLIYQDLWINYPEVNNVWDGYHYARCLYKLKDYQASLDVCRELFTMHHQSINNIYAWNIYYLEIDIEEVTDIEKYLKAANAIINLCNQQDSYSPYTRTALKMLKYCDVKGKFEMALQWVAKLNPDELSSEPFRFTDSSGKQRQISSDKEKYFLSYTKVLLKTCQYGKCIEECQKALVQVERFINDGDVWLRKNAADAMIEMGNDGEALKEYLNFYPRKKLWFIQHEIARLYFRLGDTDKAIDYGLAAALFSV
ncbi:hypothetical protein SPSYN_01398 [Sporotomaculum syntrophicum]|uniref:Tetratricopeptide repeat protein n=1 Tax=Sporotomaculum syntrophicum TaxID=182264 RepID=A0A9D2WPJ8_9FIRM|nr:hypothetical protein [Sporotomaculum syntrophicum]KAF1085262.1 hypothetical protein SPSYN_01398 [Sporotomaculum syntrophicum]